MTYLNDKRIVMTLDAGGTNFVFSALRGVESVVEPITIPANVALLDNCLDYIVKGFKEVKRNLKEKPVAISFAFPGPADYPNGIIGDLMNLPAFKGGVALGPMLQNIFQMPVFINNDGDLFAYGEAIAGLLPEVNELLEKSGSPKRYKNLFGVTLGTGFGGGLVHNGQLYIGDNAAASEIWLMRNYKYNNCFAEEGISKRAIIRSYESYSKVKVRSDITPKDIFDIAEDKQPGDRHAAVRAFEEFGTVLGDALANAVTLTDSIIVLGGGLSNAWKYFAPAMLKVLDGTIETMTGGKVNRLEMKVFSLEDETECKSFATGHHCQIKVPFSNMLVDYDPLKRIGIGKSRLGTSHAISVGAYAYALSQLKV